MFRTNKDPQLHCMYRYILYTVQSILVFLVLYCLLINRCHGGRPLSTEYIINISFILLNDLQLNFPKYLSRSTENVLPIQLDIVT